MVNIENFDPKLLNINKISLKSTDDVVYNIKYLTMKILNHVNINSENTLYLKFKSYLNYLKFLSYLNILNVDGYIEESNGNKYLILVMQTRTKKC